ncbi:hypothetical protein NHX12_027835 [Muraenolepis orangiensis]|uniref:non-specific serine/threonine protein kinase n=1 Tax=Muraenolepis orangiensis TaxID=630683 RepID=A0A9Q0EHF0_9TELE|nr:hypothetical protein NHX12_027835 [Muraenolepis orangiensis]
MDQLHPFDPEAVLTPCGLTHKNDNTDPSTLFSDLSSGLTESDLAVEPLFIFESDTQDFLDLSNRSHPALDHQMLSQRPVPQILNSHTRIPSECISLEPGTQFHHQLLLDSNSEPCTQPIELEPPTGTDNAGKDSPPVAYTESTSHVDSQAGQSENPIDLWMDACQYLSADDKGAGRSDSEGIVLNLWGGSVLREEEVCADITTWSWPCPCADTKVSGYSSTEEGDGILRASSGDIGGVWGPPRVERWSSVDSWETALSDWAAIIASPPEEITAAFTEIGAEIDALTQAIARDAEARSAAASAAETPGQASVREDPLNKGREEAVESDFQPQTQTLTAIQDQARPRPDLGDSLGESSSATTSPNTQTDAGVVKEHLEVKPEGSTVTPGEGNKHAGETRSTLDHQDSAYPVDPSLTVSCVTLSSLEECSTVIQIPGCPGISNVLEDSDTDLCQSGGYVGPGDRGGDTSIEEDIVLLHIEEDVDEDLQKESTLSELNTEEPHEGAVYKVTEEDDASQRDSSVQDGDLPRYAPWPTFSDLTGGEPETLQSEASGEDLDHFRNATHALRDTRTPPDVKAGLLGHADKQASRDTPLHHNVPSGEGPNSAMPVAPLGIGCLLLGVTGSLEGDQGCADRVELFHDNKELSCPRTKTRVASPALESTDQSPLRDRGENKTAASVGGTEHSKSSPRELNEESPVCSDKDFSHVCHIGDDTEGYNVQRSIAQEIDALSRDLANLVAVPGDRFLLSEKSRTAYFTLDLVDPFFPRATRETAPKGLQITGDGHRAGREKDLTMPHKTHRSSLTRPKKEKCGTGPLHPAAASCKRLDNLTAHVPVQPPTKGHDSHAKQDSLTGQEGKEDGSVTAGNGPAASVAAPAAKPHGKKKKKHATQNATVVKSEPEPPPPPAKEENVGKQKVMEGKISAFEAKFGTKIGKTKDKLPVISSKLDSVQVDVVQKKKSQHQACPVKEPPNGGTRSDLRPTAPGAQLNDDAVKRRRLSANKFGKMVSALESKLTKAEVSAAPKREEGKAGVDTTRRKAYSEAVQQKTPREEPKVVQPIQAECVSGDPLSLCLWCQFSAVVADHTATWSREGRVLRELKRNGGDESRVSVTISKASLQDLGKYQCVLTSLQGSLTLDYHLTYEVLSEIVVLESPKTIATSPAADVEGQEENVHCSRLLFKEDFLSQQYFGENQPASIVTEAVHFGEGMHRRAFRTKLHGDGLVSRLEPGNTCVLKVHSSLTYGTNSNDELVQKNFNLAVEECQVQNTAREYIKAYSTVAQSAEAFGEVPEIIPIYLVHRPSNDVPYATLEEELIGDFVKYSVRDGKEINLTRRDSEAGQKCCAFQHWVYHKTEGNLLVTDMQGVGMRLTDVGIATCKKGYKGFRGNCATSFIDQFKALHMCNKYCEILGLASLQPKPKKSFSGTKPKPQPSSSSSAVPKKKTFGPTVKGNAR